MSSPNCVWGFIIESEPTSSPVIEIAEVGGDRGAADVDGDAVEVLAQTGPDIDDPPALPDGHRDLPVGVAQSGSPSVRMRSRSNADLCRDRGPANQVRRGPGPWRRPELPENTFDIAVRICRAWPVRVPGSSGARRGGSRCGGRWQPCG